MGGGLGGRGGVYVKQGLHHLSIQFVLLEEPFNAVHHEEENFRHTFYILHKVSFLFVRYYRNAKNFTL